MVMMEKVEELNEEQVFPLTDQERFTRDLITTYKEQSVLWDKNHLQYRSRAHRNEAHEVLLQKCREYYPEADEDFVKMKIDSLRSSFRKEWRKVRFSKASGKKPEEVYKPNLWYYNLLLFTVGEKCTEDNKISVDMRMFWPREYSTMLITLLRKHPCLYVNNPIPTLAKRNAAIKKITDEMNIYTGRIFAPDHIRKKIQLLKGQYRFECKKIRERRRNNPKHPYKSSLWCFNMLSFLKGHVFQQSKMWKSEARKALRSREYAEAKMQSESEEIEVIKKEADSEQDNDSLENYRGENKTNQTEMEFINETEYDDIFDTIGKNVAYKLRDMPDDQRKYAETLINEILYYGLMERLTADTELILNNDT